MSSRALTATASPRYDLRSFNAALVNPTRKRSLGIGVGLDVIQKRERGIEVDRQARSVFFERCHCQNIERIVGLCDGVIAVWDGQPAAGGGGTGDIVDYCKSLGKPVDLIPVDASYR